MPYTNRLESKQVMKFTLYRVQSSPGTIYFWLNFVEIRKVTYANQITNFRKYILNIMSYSVIIDNVSLWITFFYCPFHVCFHGLPKSAGLFNLEISLEPSEDRIPCWWSTRLYLKSSDAEVLSWTGFSLSPPRIWFQVCLSTRLASRHS